MKEEIRRIYAELKGYSSQEQTPDQTMITEATVWDQYNDVIDELNQVTSSENYLRYRIVPGDISGFGKGINSFSLKMKAAGLVGRLHAEYFPDEPDPLASSPDTVISQSQEQAQSFQFQLVLEFQSTLDQKIPQHKEGTKERTFLDKLKGSLASVRDTAGLLKLILQTGKEIGLSFEDILRIFG